MLRLAKNVETRKRMWIANCHKAHPANLTVLPEIIQMRSKIAQILLGSANASDSDLAFAKVKSLHSCKRVLVLFVFIFILFFFFFYLKGRRMAGDSPSEVVSFLSRMKDLLKDKAETELKVFSFLFLCFPRCVNSYCRNFMT